jgi:hypothetical protein
MWLFDGNIDGRPLMERDGSGVSALVGLGFVVCAQLLEDASDRRVHSHDHVECVAHRHSLTCAVRSPGIATVRVASWGSNVAPVHARR